MLASHPFARAQSLVEGHARLHRRDCWPVWRGSEAGRPLTLWRAEAPAARALLLTDGASSGPVALAQEFLLYSAQAAPWHATLLRALVRQALGGAWLGWGQVLPFPLLVPAEIDRHRHGPAGLLLSPPFLEPPRFEALFDHDEAVHLTMVTPLDAAQFAYGQAAGGAALESALARGEHAFMADEAHAGDAREAPVHWSSP